MRILLAAAMVVACLARGPSPDEWEGIEALDLKNMRAHEQQIQIETPAPESRPILEEYMGKLRGCEELMGEGSLPTGRTDGGGRPMCFCAGAISASGRCDAAVKAEDDSKPRKSWLADKLADKSDAWPVPCSSASDCADKLYRRYQTVDTDRVACSEAEQYLRGAVERINTTFARDRKVAEEKDAIVNEWFERMSEQNAKMVVELRRYTTVQKDYARLAKEESKVRAENVQLKEQLRQLEKELDELESKRQEMQENQANVERACQDRLKVLREGLERENVPVPQLS